MSVHQVTVAAIVGDCIGAAAVLVYYAYRVRKWWTYPEGTLIVLLFATLTTGILPVGLQILLNVNEPWLPWFKAGLFISTFVLLVSTLAVMHRRLTPAGAHVRRP